MSESVKQVILRDPKTNEILIPKIIGTLGYEPAEDGTLVPPYTNDADMLGGKTADQFAAVDHNHDNNYATKNHDHSGVYATPEQLNEVKTSVAEGKALIAAAVSDKGVETAANAEFATIAANIQSIESIGLPDLYYPVVSADVTSAMNMSFSTQDTAQYTLSTTGTMIIGSPNWATDNWALLVMCRYRTSSSSAYHMFSFIITNENVQWGTWFNDPLNNIAFSISHTSLPVPTGNDTCLYLLVKQIGTVYSQVDIGAAYSGIQ